MNLQRRIQKHFSLHKFSLYFLCGFASYLFNLVLTFVLAEVLGIHYLTSFIIALSLTTLFNFYLAAKIVFKVHRGFATKFLLHALSVVTFYFLNIQLVKWLVEGMGIHYAIAISIATVIFFVVKFLLYDKYVFADEKQERKRT